MFATAQKANAKPSNSSLSQRDRANDAFIQPKLTIGKPGDAHEIEADRVADTVVARGNERTASSPFFAPSPSIHRQSEEELQTKSGIEEQIRQKPLVDTITQLVRRQPEEEQLQGKENRDEDVQKKGLLEDSVQEKPATVLAPSIQKQEEEVREKDDDDVQLKEEEKIQKQSVAGADPEDTSSLEGNLNSSKGRGSPLPATTKNEMESGFGTDFSGVRVHNDSNAVHMNQNLGAQAFTHGNDIYFNEGKYNPQSNSGKHLLAHELTHTIQQERANTVQKSEEETTEEKLAHIIHDGDSSAIILLTDAELNVSTPVQRAGMIRIFLDQLWVNYEEENMALHLLRYKDQADQVLPLLDAIGYRQVFYDSVDDTELREILIATVADVQVRNEGGDMAIAILLANPDSDYRSVMSVEDFTAATNLQRLGLLALLFRMNWSDRPEEAKMLDILASSGEQLAELMNQLTGLGLKQILFDNIDNHENALRFTQLIGDLNDPVLDADLDVFNRGMWGDFWYGLGGGILSAYENFSLGSIIMGFLHPIIHPIDSVVTIFNQAIEVVKDFDLSLGTLDRIVTAFRDAAGFIVMWLLLFSALASIIATAVAAGYITLPASVPIAAIAAGLWYLTGVVGIVFIVLATIKLCIDLREASLSTTARELEREQEDIGEDLTLLGVIALLAGIIKGMKLMVERFKQGALDPNAAKPEILEETSTEIETGKEKATEEAHRAEEDANEARERAEEEGERNPAEETEGRPEEGDNKPVEDVEDVPEESPPELQPRELPDVWRKFKADFHSEFIEKLRIFRGNDNLNPNAGGGEGKIFLSELSGNAFKTLKRWFNSQLEIMPDSISRLRNARDAVKSDSVLNETIEVVEIYEQGSDWIIRDYDPTSYELKQALDSNTPAAVEANHNMLAEFSRLRGTEAGKVLTKIKKAGDNVHWSAGKQKILIIDMR